MRLVEDGIMSQGPIDRKNALYNSLENAYVAGWQLCFEFFFFRVLWW